MGNSLHVMNRRNKVKKELIEYKGGKCEHCGYNDIKYLSVFHFHHLNEDEKEFSIGSNMTLAIDRLKKEINKCVMLCIRCHTIEHEKILVSKREERLSQQEKTRKEAKRRRIKKEKILSTPRKCEQCGEEYLPKSMQQKYCTPLCSSRSQRKVIRPSKKVLADIIDNVSWVEIGHKYNVSDNTIRKWAKSYGLL